MEDGHIFPSLFLKAADGFLIVKVRNERSIPRKGDHLTAVVLSGAYGSYRNWSNSSWFVLRSKYQIAFSEAVCVWHSQANEKGFTLVGFRGVTVEFVEKIKEGNVIIFGPQEPPRDYILNLRNLADRKSPDNKFFQFKANKNDWTPKTINSKINVAKLIFEQLELCPNMVIQGPPGTGKTHKIAETIELLLKKGKSVLVTALTNRALLEVASKPNLKEFLRLGKIEKTGVSIDEMNELPDLIPTKSIESTPGVLTLSTFYIASGKALTIDSPIFDYVIMDEASQALLGMFEATLQLGNRVVWIGDQSQLPPIVCLRDRDIVKFRLEPLIFGMNTLCDYFSFPSFFMNETFRLSNRGANYTSKFYATPLTAKKHRPEKYQYANLSQEYKQFFHPDGGPTWIRIPMSAGELEPIEGILFVVKIVQELNQTDSSLKIAILTKYKKTVRKMQ